MRDMEAWGAYFERDEHGQVVRSLQMGQIVGRNAMVESKGMMETLQKRLEAVKVQCLERTLITGLLTSDGCHPTMGGVVGIFGFNTVTGEPVIIRARATVLTTGGTDRNLALAGDGIAQAFQAGAEISDMEFARGYSYSIGHQNTHVRLGMRLLNSKGENILERYYPELKGRLKRDQMALAVMVEEIESKGPILADYTQLSPENMRLLRTLFTTAEWVRSVENEGIDLSRQPTECYHVSSGYPHTSRGGIRQSIYGEASLPGLFTAGEAAANAMSNLDGCLVPGYRAGESAARYAREGPSLQLKQEQVDMLREKTFQPLKRKVGVKAESFKGLMAEFDRALCPANVSVFKSEKGLRAALSQVENWKKELLANLVAEDIRSLVWANKAESLIVCAELVYRACLEREESRCYALRAEFPYRDDINWLKCVILRRERDGDGIDVSRFSLPIYRWPVKPAKYEKIPLPFPMPKV